MMALVKRIKGFMAGLMRLAVVCLVVEQLGYLVLVPGYYWELLASPVFWGVFSGVCFYQLWRFNRKYPVTKSSKVVSDGWNADWEDAVCTKINPATGFTMNGGVDAAGYLYGQEPSIG